MLKTNVDGFFHRLELPSVKVFYVQPADPARGTPDALSSSNPSTTTKPPPSEPPEEEEGGEDALEVEGKEINEVLVPVRAEVVTYPTFVLVHP